MLIADDRRAWLVLRTASPRTVLLTTGAATLALAIAGPASLEHRPVAMLVAVGVALLPIPFAIAAVLVLAADPTLAASGIVGRLSCLDLAVIALALSGAVRVVSTRRIALSRAVLAAGLLTAAAGALGT